MNVRSVFLLAAVVVFGALAWRVGGGKGVLLLASGLVTWLLLWYTRLVSVIKRASQHPVGYVGSATVLNTRLKPGLPLLHVVAMTCSIGQRLSAIDAQPEVYCWTDPERSRVTAEFQGGRVKQWRLEHAAEAAATPGLPDAGQPQA